MLITHVAQDAIGELTRAETDPDWLHIAGLRILLEAGFPASILTSIDRVFCLRRNTAGEQVRALYRWIVDQIEAHGFRHKPGDIDARVLVEWMDPPVGEDLVDPESRLIELLTKAKAEGHTEFRLAFPGLTGGPALRD